MLLPSAGVVLPSADMIGRPESITRCTLLFEFHLAHLSTLAGSIISSLALTGALTGRHRLATRPPSLSAHKARSLARALAYLAAELAARRRLAPTTTTTAICSISARCCCHCRCRCRLACCSAPSVCVFVAVVVAVAVAVGVAVGVAVAAVAVVAVRVWR